MCLKELMLTKPMFWVVYYLSLLELSWDKFWISAKSIQCLSSWFNTNKAMSFNDVAIVSDKANDYRIQFWYIIKDEKCWFKK